MTGQYNDSGNIGEDDYKELSEAFAKCHTNLVDDEDKELLMLAFNTTKRLLNHYSNVAIAANHEATLLKGKQVQMKLQASNLLRAAKAFREVSG